jgi:hypothetical protein
MSLQKNSRGRRSGAKTDESFGEQGHAVLRYIEIDSEAMEDVIIYEYMHL